MGRSSGSPRYRTSRQLLLGSLCSGGGKSSGAQAWCTWPNRGREAGGQRMDGRATDAAGVARLRAPALLRRSAPPPPLAPPRPPPQAAPPAAEWPPGTAAAGAGPAVRQPAVLRASRESAYSGCARQAQRVLLSGGSARHACLASWAAEAQPSGAARALNPGARASLFTHLWLEDVGGDVQQVARHVGGPSLGGAEQREALGGLQRREVPRTRKPCSRHQMTQGTARPEV